MRDENPFKWSDRVRLSVLIDTYNHKALVEQAINHVFEQDFPASEREVIVVDDGSTDRTAEIMQPFAPQVRLIRQNTLGSLPHSTREFRNVVTK
jgi:glycosyltransferase involved in cell wall biosynthesis